MPSRRNPFRWCGLALPALILLVSGSYPAQADSPVVALRTPGFSAPVPAWAQGDTTPPPQQAGADSAAAPAVAAPAVVAPAVAAPAPPAAAASTTGGTITATAETPAAEAPDPDGGWPRAMTTVSGSTIILYQPQLLTWERQREVVAMAAISYLGKGASKPEMGTLKLSSPTSVSMEDRLVSLTRVQISEINFSSLAKEKSQEVLAELMKALPEAPVVVSLDRVLAMMDKSQIRADGIQVKTDPPTIHMSTKPAILVLFDGEPILAPITGTTLKYVVNTNWDVLIDDATKIYYLRHEASWYQTTDLKGKWEQAKKLPKGFENIPDDDNWREVKENIPGKGKKPPVIFVSMSPAELLLLDGNPKYAEIEKKGDLLWVTNTESDLFRMKKADFYYLVSGRWFRAAAPEGPWKFATADLPAEFRQIPPDHERARVRSSIPGTDEAAEAVLMAQVPQTARVNAREIKAPDVKYDGDPDFKAIEGTPVTFAANCSHDVVRLREAYYLCDRGIWFTSASPTGPWVVATSVPDEIYTIPPSSPVHHVTYVTVVDPDPAYPTYSYTAGYMGVSIAFGCAMWGTGYHYPPYYHYPMGGYPVYYPRPVTYGGGAMYNPWTGSYGHYQSAYGPYGGAARGATYNPNTGTYKRGAVAYGPGGAQGYGQAYNPRTGTYAATRQGSNAYGSWGSSYVQRGDDWARTQRVTDAQGNTKWAAAGSGGGAAAGWQGPGNTGGFVGQSGSGDVYAGRNGNVYKKTDGGWQQYENGGWNDVSGGGNRPSQQPGGGSGAASRPSTQPSTRPGGGQAATQPAGGGAGVSSMDQLNRDAQARNQGAQRSRDYGSYQRSGGSSSRGGSYSGSRSSASTRGGGLRGGGGGRRR